MSENKDTKIIIVTLSETLHSKIKIYYFSEK